MLNGLPLHRLPQPITEDTIVRDACDYGFRTRRRSDLLNASQVSLDHVVICATGSRSTLVEFFRVIVPSLRGTFKLVTLESDESAPPLASMLEEPKLISWFGWNIGMSHPKLRALPIGLNEGRHRAAVEAARSRTRAPGNGRVLINFHISPMRPERIDLWEQSEFWPFADRRLYNRSMVFQRPGVEGTTTRDAFYALLTRYSFVASPRGLGTDTHRTWEALCHRAQEPHIGVVQRAAGDRAEGVGRSRQGNPASEPSRVAARIVRIGRARRSDLDRKNQGATRARNASES